MTPSSWKDALIDQSVDDDLTSAVDLKADYEFLTVIIPTLDGAHTTTVHVGRSEDGTFYPAYTLDGDSTGDHAEITTGATTTHSVIFRIGGYRYIKLMVSTGVTTDKTFYVRGFNR